MAIPAEESNIHWNYFLALEQDLEKISRYIEFHPDNYGTYSIELAHLLLAASSEVDVVLKMICKILGPNVERRDIGSYRFSIQNHAPELLDIRCQIPKFQMNDIKPWDNWSNNGETNPEWWNAYNDVKHRRMDNFHKANLKNTLNALSALSIVIFFYNYLKRKDNLIYIHSDIQSLAESDLNLKSNFIKYKGAIVIEGEDHVSN